MGLEKVFFSIQDDLVDSAIPGSNQDLPRGSQIGGREQRCFIPSNRFNDHLEILQLLGLLPASEQVPVLAFGGSYYKMTP